MSNWAKIVPIASTDCDRHSVSRQSVNQENIHWGARRVATRTPSPGISPDRCSHCSCSCSEELFMGCVSLLLSWDMWGSSWPLPLNVVTYWGNLVNRVDFWEGKPYVHVAGVGVRWTACNTPISYPSGPPWSSQGTYSKRNWFVYPSHCFLLLTHRSRVRQGAKAI